MKQLYIFIALVVTISVTNAFSADLSYNPEWGIGILMPSKGSIYDLSPGMILPENGFRVYEIPSGKKYADLLISVNTAAVDDGTNRKNIADTDKVMVGPEVTCLKIYETTANFVKVLVSTRKGGYWIANKDLASAGYMHTSWMKALLMVKQGLYVNIEGGLNVRDIPASTGQKVITMQKDTFFITLTGKTKDNWAEAEVVEMDAHPCDGGKEINHYKGWIKIIDDMGFPNIWYLVIGC